jgi:pimeloyl-ACP methyl ester carboxylesterase
MTRLHWLDAGTGPAVVLLHAFPCDHRMWRAQVPTLVEAGWRVLVPDLPGFGASSLPQAPTQTPTERPPEAGPSLGAVVDLIVADLLELGIDRLIVGGLSVGGYLVMEWLRKDPQMLAGIALCDTKATADAPAAKQGRLEMAATIESDPTVAARLLRERVLPEIVGETTHTQRPEVVALVAGWMDAAAPQTIAWYQRAMAARPDSLDTLTECEVPALVLWGEQDSMSDRSEQQLMLDALRDARFTTIAGAGHLSAIENPAGVGSEVLTFAQAVRRSTLDG